MKRYFLLLALFACFSFLHAENPERIEHLSTKVILKNTNGYFILSDKSCWKVIGFSKRWRSFSEWWNNVQLPVPENYSCVPGDWYLGAEIEIYSKYDHLDVSETDASNREILKQCTHLMVNRHTKQILFAIAMEPSECIVQISKESYEDGYSRGHSAGYSEGYSSGHSCGYSSGYTQGYAQGSAHGRSY